MDKDKQNRSSRPKDSFEVFSSASLKNSSQTPSKQDLDPPSLKKPVKKTIHSKPVADKEYQQIRDELKELDQGENIVWMGRSSQMIHLVAYIFCIFFCWLLFPIVIAYFIHLQTKRTTYVITDQRLRVYSGIFVRRIDDVELYRVKDTIFLQPFILGRFGLSNIQLITSDSSWGDALIPGITNGRILREKIRRIVESAREKKGVREVDYYTHSIMPPGL